ncbi:cytochrome c oxidase subunit 3 [Flavobacterium agricola]|uniref:Cytochrome c oxidase subunit 3 n=1 Tax=Flavobacterium agricola TaxID=2870839 RepID=A0ABY6LZC3_9FLAO|nr:cytochrome c oxidase subunit 3 [Flavobacterium agricola]UYW00759.1 cytochrome c oxidase subunit 3 [Flavobacterium agricola]
MINQEEYDKKAKSYKMLLWFGMISIVMMFAGFTSAYVISKSRPDWLDDFQMPSAFLFSTIVIILSSFTFHFAVKSVKHSNPKKASSMLWLTLLLAIVFIILQFVGFGQVIDSGLYFTGTESTITTSFLYIVIIVHLAHLVGGIVSLLIVIYNNSKQKYTAAQPVGIELSATFWHFLGVLWLYLFLFFSFYN